MNGRIEQTNTETWSRVLAWLGEKKPWSRRRRRRQREDRKEDTQRGGGGGRDEQEEISLPACSAESSQQVRAWSLATAVGSSRSSWLEALLRSFCCGMFSTYYTQLTSSHRRFMQINVRPRDICLLTDSGLFFPLGAVDSICLCRFMLIQVPGFMEDGFVMWLHSALERWHFNVTTAGWSILRLFYFFIESKRKKKSAAM